MKLSQVLCKQHIGRQIRNNWYTQGRVKFVETNAEKSLAARGINVVDPLELFQRPKKRYNIDSSDWLVRNTDISQSEDWNDTQCLVVDDNEILVEGVIQAQKITKTVIVDNKLPDSTVELIQDSPKEIHELVNKIIKSSVIFDAHQEKLPKIKDPLRPAWNFPRSFGITDIRKITNLSKKIFHLCGALCGPEVAKTKSIVENALMGLPFEKEFNLYKFSLTMDLMLMSQKPLDPILKATKETSNMFLPSMHPMHHSIGLKKTNLYKLEDLYPLASEYQKKYIHTIFVYHNPETVKHITELDVTEAQVMGRSLLKAFTAAACSARQRFGAKVKELPQPITIHCIYSDGRKFYFSVYQLNTLDIEGDQGVKNLMWKSPKLNLYEKGGYFDGKPAVEGYNSKVFDTILAFYKNN